MNPNEFVAEDAALWFGELGYAIRHEPRTAPGEKREVMLRIRKRALR